MPYPESANSFMTGNAPAGANYAAPLVNFSELAQLPDQYFKGTQNRRTLNLQNAFPDGLPKDASGQIDMNAVTDKLTKLGGAEYASQLLPYLYGNEGANSLKSIDAGVNGGEPPAPPVAPRSTSVPSVSGPANITGPARNAAPGPSSAPTSSAAPAQPALSSAGTDNNGADTVRSILTEHAGGQDVSPIIPRVAAAFKVDPDASLTPQQAQVIRSKLPTSITPQQPAAPSPTTGGGAPVNPVGGTGGNGAPAPGTSAETAAPASGIVPQPAPQPVRVAQNQSPVPGISQDAITAAENDPVAQRLIKAIAQTSQVAARLGKTNPAAAQAAIKQGEVYQMQLKERLDLAAKNAEQTPTQKDVTSGVEADKAAIAANIKSSETQMAGIRGSAGTYEGENGLQPKVQLATAILNDPRIYTGTGGDFSKMVNRASAIYGATAPAALQEMLEKITAGAALAQVNGLKTSMMEAGGASSSAGRIFQQQVDLINKASPQLGTTLVGNRALVEIERRTGEQSLAVRDLALQYLGPPDANGVPTKHKFLDIGFDKVLSNYLQGHPLFTKQEMAEPTLLGAPTAPPVKDKAQAAAWISGMGLQPGDPYRVGGQIKMVPRPVAPAVRPSPGTAQAAPQQ